VLRFSRTSEDTNTMLRRVVGVSSSAPFEGLRPDAGAARAVSAAAGAAAAGAAEEACRSAALATLLSRVRVSTSACCKP